MISIVPLPMVLDQLIKMASARLHYKMTLILLVINKNFVGDA